MQNLVLNGRLGKIIENLEKGPVVPLCLITEGLVGNILQIGARETTIMTEEVFFRQDRLQKEEIHVVLWFFIVK